MRRTSCAKEITASENSRNARLALFVATGSKYLSNCVKNSSFQRLNCNSLGMSVISSSNFFIVGSSVKGFLNVVDIGLGMFD